MVIDYSKAYNENFTECKKMESDMKLKKSNNIRNIMVV